MRVSIYAEYIDDEKDFIYGISSMDRWGERFRITDLIFKDRDEAEIYRKHYAQFAKFVRSEAIHLMENSIRELKEDKDLNQNV